METVQVQATPRSTSGTKDARAVRREGMIPCIIYGRKEGAVPVTVSGVELKDAVFTPDFKTVTLILDGEEIHCIIRDIQFHPVTDKIMHVDFQRLSPGSKIQVKVPVHFEGTAPGLRAGGKLFKRIRKIDIKTTPESLISEIVMDVSELELGQALRVRDIELPEGIQVLNVPSNPVVSVEIPRVILEVPKEEEEEELEELEGLEGEEGAEGEGGETEGEDSGEGGGEEDSEG